MAARKSPRRLPTRLEGWDSIEGARVEAAGRRCRKPDCSSRLDPTRKISPDSERRRCRRDLVDVARTRPQVSGRPESLHCCAWRDGIGRNEPGAWRPRKRFSCESEPCPTASIDPHRRLLSQPEAEQDHFLALDDKSAVGIVRLIESGPDGGRWQSGPEGRSRDRGAAREQPADRRQRRSWRPGATFGDGTGSRTNPCQCARRWSSFKRAARRSWRGDHCRGGGLSGGSPTDCRDEVDQKLSASPSSKRGATARDQAAVLGWPRPSAPIRRAIGLLPRKPKCPLMSSSGNATARRT
jgi:hypothetical protein